MLRLCYVAVRLQQSGRARVSFRVLALLLLLYIACLAFWMELG